MIQRVIAGVDGTETGLDAVALGRLLANATGAELVATHIYEIPNPQAALAGWGRIAMEHGERALQEAVGNGGERQELAGAGSPARGLHNSATRMQADLIVVGSSQQTRLGRVLAGSVGERLLHGSPCAVAVAPAGFRDQDAELKRVAIGWDGGPESEIAFETAAELTRAAGGTLRVLTVVEPVELPADPTVYALADPDELTRAREDFMRSELERGLALAPGDIEVSGELVTPGMSTLSEREDMDLMVVGSRGYGPIRRVLLGSVSAQLVRNAACPVMVCPRSAAPED